MVQRILIVGINPFDSGKTLFSKGLIHKLSGQDIKVSYMKPISGHNSWQKNWHTYQCMQEGKLYSSDVREIMQVYSSPYPVEAMNPIHSLFVPKRLASPEEVYSASFDHGTWDSILAVKRMSKISNHGVDSVSLVNSSMLLDSSELLINKDDIERLTKGTEVIPFESRFEEFAYSEQVLESNLSKALEFLENDADVVIIEGFNDSAWPWEGLESVDAVYAIGPGHAFSYEPSRFKKAVELSRYRSQPIRETTVMRVVEMIKPMSRIYTRQRVDPIRTEPEEESYLLERMIRH